MLFRLFTTVCLIASMSFVSQLAHAQKVANYDLTDAKPLERLRPPVPTSPLPRLRRHETACILHHRRHPKNPMRESVVELLPTSYLRSPFCL